MASGGGEPHSPVAPRESTEIGSKRVLLNAPGRVHQDVVVNVGGGEANKKGAKAKAKAAKNDEKAAALRKDIDLVAHTWPLDQLYEHYHTDPERGLNAATRAENLEKYGPNMLSPPPVTPWWIKYLAQYINFFAILLEVAAILCFISYAIDVAHDPTNLYLGIVLIAVVVVTATFAYMTEAKSESIMEGFKKLVPAKCNVIRDGILTVIDAVDIVPGDVVELTDGDRVPADVRLIRANDLKVDNSSLTGEAEPVERTPELAMGSNGQLVTQPLEAQNLLFYTTIITSGTGRAVVVGTGDHTVMGQIAGLAGEPNLNESPIAREINAFIKLIAALAISMGILFGILAIIVGNSIIATIVFAIGVIVANVPEGLMAAVTVSLALAAKRMHAKNVLVKNLTSVETLGSTTIIASDKTGTLTQNRMTVQHCWYDLTTFNTPAAKNRRQWMDSMKTRPPTVYNPDSVTFKKLQMVTTLCNNANFLTARPDLPPINLAEEILKPEFNMLSLDCSGDASEQGLLKFVEPIRSAAEYRALCPKLFEIKFNSTNKWQLSIHRQEKPGTPPILVLKGAPERVLQRCSKLMVNGEEREMSDEMRTSYTTAYEELGGFGERVLGFAYRDLTSFDPSFEFSSKPEPNFPTDGLTFVGLISLIDPPRDGVPEAVEKCKRGGIRVFMVTGDHPITARAIAKQVGILDQDKLDAGTATVISGDEIREWLEMPKEQALAKWDAALDHQQLVWARVSPAHKLLIVENCQRRGNIVAVTGDGVNDAPALKKGDIGIAMGIAGKDVSKDAADMILMDDNFASIVNGVEEGRLIFDNLKKTICYALSVNIPELVPFLAYVLLKIPLPLSTVLMLAICLGTDMFPAIALAYESKESDIMERPPRNAKTDRLVGWNLVCHAYIQIGMIQVFAGFLAYLVVFNDYGYTPNMLMNIGINFSSQPILCTVDENNKPVKCGYGCDEPDYARGVPSPVEYCKEGCKIPLPFERVDPFSEMGHSGFRGAKYCGLTCSSPVDLFPGGKLPLQCNNGTLRDKVGFPGRKRMKPSAPEGAWYWWAGRQQPFPNHTYQREVTYYAQSAYFVAIVVTQIANVVICKTRKLSVFQQGLENNVVNMGLIFELAVTLFLLYIPPLQTVFSTRPMRVMHWFIGLPFAVYIFAYGETRKYLIRKHPGGFVDRMTYW